MQKKLNRLSFVIGLFFIIISTILMIDYSINHDLKEKINLYSGIVFFVFGLFMLLVKSSED
jgi:predicted membrane channel-forming protein YqfA (hemolysin III family)